MSEITFEFATKDDCLDKMVPSDLRLLVGQRDKAQAELAELKAISLNGNLSWQDKHIAAFKILNPELLQEKG